jgi:hypothetical protein
LTLSDPAPDEINRGSGGPIDITGTTHRALLLGLKPGRTYTYRIVAKAGAATCTSRDQTITTAVSPGAPTLTRTTQNAEARARGFIVTSTGYPGGLVQAAYIIDTDGDVVWWAFSPPQCSRALMDWEGAIMWMVATNPAGVGRGEVSRIGMDGSNVLYHAEGLADAHHDIAVAPGGIVTTLSRNQNDADSSDLVERLPDGTLRVVVKLDETILRSRVGGMTLHANSIQYHPGDDSYTVGDLYAGAIVKVSRQGQVIWQIAPDCVGIPAPKCASAAIGGNHGHHVLANGNILVFGVGTEATVSEFELTETSTSITASLIWTYTATGKGSMVLGDTQRLPNGNTLIVYSTQGLIDEVSPDSVLVQSLKTLSMAGSQVTSSVGYANFRETLYGPPER